MARRRTGRFGPWYRGRWRQGPWCRRLGPDHLCLPLRGNSLQLLLTGRNLRFPLLRLLTRGGLLLCRHRLLPRLVGRLLGSLAG